MKTSRDKTYMGWKISYWMKPIPFRGHDWEAVHEDYDGTDTDGRVITKSETSTKFSPPRGSK